MANMSPRIKVKKGRPLANWPGGNTPPVIVIDTFTASPSIAANPDTGFTATATDAEQGDISASIEWYIVTAFATAGVADAAVAPFLAATVTALPANTYAFDVTVDGGSLQQLTITTVGGESYAAIAALMDAVVVGGTVTAEDGVGFRVTSDTTGATSTVVVAAGTGVAAGGDLFAAIDAADTTTTTFPAPVDGTDETTALGGTGANPSLSFVVEGVQDVEASITDGFGATTTAVQSVTVTA